MLEDSFRRRTADLVSKFQNDVEALAIGNPSNPAVLASLNGVAKNTIRLLRENKTRSVRQQTSSPKAIDYGAVNAEIDDAVQRVFAAKDSWNKLYGAAPADQPTWRLQTPPSDRSISLTGELLSLAELHESGMLSDAEFAAAKARLL